MGITTNPVLETITSISDSGTLKIHSSSSEKSDELVDLTPDTPRHALKHMLDLSDRNLIVVSNFRGQIFLYQIASKNQEPYDLVKTLEIETKSEVKAMCTNNENHLIAGAMDGTLTIFDLNKPGNEKYAKQLLVFQGKAGVRCVQWRDKPRKEIITGHVDGIVTVWDLRE